MSESQVGAPRALRLIQRMDRMNLSERKLAERAGLDRASVHNARDGRARAGTYGVLERTLDEIEDELDLPPFGELVSTVTLPNGIVVQVHGATPARLAEAVELIVEKWDARAVGDAT